MKTSIAIAAALVLTSLVFIPVSAAARGAGHGLSGSGQIHQGVTHIQPAFGRRGFGGFGRRFHPYSAQ